MKKSLANKMNYNDVISRTIAVDFKNLFNAANGFRAINQV